MKKRCRVGRRLPRAKGGGYLLSLQYVWRLADQVAREHPEVPLPLTR